MEQLAHQEENCEKMEEELICLKRELHMTNDQFIFWKNPIKETWDKEDHKILAERLGNRLWKPCEYIQ